MNGLEMLKTLRAERCPGHILVLTAKDTPEDKVRGRFRRLWGHLHDAIELVDDAHVYDNVAAAQPFRLVASFRDGCLIGTAAWPHWTPEELRDAGA